MAQTAAHLLDGSLEGPDGKGPYHYPYHDRLVCCSPGGQTRRGATESAAGIGDVYPTLRQCAPCEHTFSFHRIEGVFLNHTEQGFKPRFMKVDPPSDADIADVVQKISRRVVRKLGQLEYLEAGIDEVVVTGYDPLLDNEPELARAMAASVKHRSEHPYSGP